MTDDTIRLLELLQTRGAGNSLKELSKVVLQRLMKFEVEGVIGRGRHERSD
jgi:putative transposase